MTACCVHFPFLLEIQIKIPRQPFEIGAVLLVFIVDRKGFDLAFFRISGKGSDHPFRRVADFGGDVPLCDAV